MIEKFASKVALVTGAGSGIGRAAALAFASKGAKVVVVDVDVEGGEETVRLVHELNGEAIFVKADVSQAVEVEAMVNKTTEVYGRLDYAHNNAGIIGENASTVEYSEDKWDRLININLKGIWLCLKYEIPQMLKQGGGAIVNTSSIAGLVGFRNSPAYVASKHGIVGLTKAAALDFAQQNIRINAVCPGFIRTPMADQLIDRQPKNDNPSMVDRLLKRNAQQDETAKAEQWFVEQEPVGRLGTPEEVAEAVIWLCSDAASFVTGHALAVDGGYLMK